MEWTDAAAAAMGEEWTDAAMGEEWTDAAMGEEWTDAAAAAMTRTVRLGSVMSDFSGVETLNNPSCISIKNGKFCYRNFRLKLFT